MSEPRSFSWNRFWVNVASVVAVVTRFWSTVSAMPPFWLLACEVPTARTDVARVVAQSVPMLWLKVSHLVGEKLSSTLPMKRLVRSVWGL
jgi:hypothetical protein